MTMRDRILDYFRERGSMTQSAAREGMRYNRGTWDIRFRELVDEGELVAVGSVLARGSGKHGSRVSVYDVGVERPIDQFLRRPVRVSV